VTKFGMKSELQHRKLASSLGWPNALVESIVDLSRIPIFLSDCLRKTLWRKTWKWDSRQANRVRKTGTEGPLGTVERVRIEPCVRRSKSMNRTAQRNRHCAVGTNGTLSHFVPGGLEKVE